MKKTFLILIVISLFASCSRKEKHIVITTEYGDIKCKLFEETPKHRDNFIKLTKQGFYQDLLFHRVINNFMIQGGDPDSKNATLGQILGDGGPGYQIDAEFIPSLFHRKGAIAAARTGDNENPDKKSSGSQFYIVQGRVYAEQELRDIVIQRNRSILVEIVNGLKLDHKQEIMMFHKENDKESLQKLLDQIKFESSKRFKENRFQFTEEQREVYTTIGGAPHLDGAYTVFGQVAEGLEVIDFIAAVETDENDRPIKDITMSLRIKK